MALETRFTLILRPDTEDVNEAQEDAEGFIEMAKESWYTSIRLAGTIDVYDVPDDE